MNAIKYIGIGLLAALLILALPQLKSVMGAESFWLSIATLLVLSIIGLGIDLFYVTKKLRPDTSLFPKLTPHNK